jgi:hypothetical protein
MSLHGSSGYLQLSCDFIVLTALQQQFHNLFFTLRQTDLYTFHQAPPSDRYMRPLFPGFLRERLLPVGPVLCKIACGALAKAGKGCLLPISIALTLPLGATLVGDSWTNFSTTAIGTLLAPKRQSGLIVIASTWCAFRLIRLRTGRNQSKCPNGA